MALSVIIPCFFPWNPYLKTDCTSLLVLFSIKDQNTILKNCYKRFRNFFTEVKCKENTQITNTEETGKTSTSNQATLGKIFNFLKL